MLQFTLWIFTDITKEPDYPPQEKKVHVHVEIFFLWFILKNIASSSFRVEMRPSERIRHSLQIG